MRNTLKKEKAITLVALIITIIVLLILAIVSINLVMNGGIIGKAEHGKNKYLEAEIREQVNLAYNEWKMDNESGGTSNSKDIVENRMKDIYGEDAVNVANQGKGVFIQISKFGKDYQYSLVNDGTVKKSISLNIEDGSIRISSTGYIQGEESIQQYNGTYIITGHTKDNVVTIEGAGKYDITLDNLEIDVYDKGLCAFDANSSLTGSGCFVNLLIQGDNILKSGLGKAGLQFKRCRSK